MTKLSPRGSTASLSASKDDASAPESPFFPPQKRRWTIKEELVDLEVDHSVDPGRPVTPGLWTPWTVPSESASRVRERARALTPPRGLSGLGSTSLVKSQIPRANIKSIEP